MASILLLDDDPAVADVLARQLHRLGHAVLTCGNGYDGMRAFSRHRFDVVVTDIFMPDVDGIGFIIALRRIDRDIPVIAMTGAHLAPPGARRGYDYLDAARKLGATATIYKPFRYHDLDELVGACLDTASRPVSGPQEQRNSRSFRAYTDGRRSNA